MVTPNKKVEAEMTSIVVKGKLQSLPELNEWLKNGGAMTYPFGKHDRLFLMVRYIARTEVGAEYLFNQNRDTRQRCFDLIFDESFPEVQRVHQMSTIAKLDMVIETLLMIAGNQKLPLFTDWSPTFGLFWQQKAKVLITSNDWHNPFWLEQYSTLVRPHIEAKREVVSKHGDAKLPLQADSIRDVKLRKRRWYKHVLIIAEQKEQLMKY